MKRDLIDGYDILLGAGFLLLSAGLWLRYGMAVTFIVAGAVATAAGVLLAWWTRPRVR